MNSRDFIYWLQGYFEIGNIEELDKTQVQIIKRHLALVFKHEIDPSYSGNQTELQNIHDGTCGLTPVPPRPIDLIPGEQTIYRC